MKKARLVALALLFLAVLTGCMFRSPSELYQLPQRSPGYEKLTAKIDEVRQALEQQYDTTAEPAVIYSGSNTSNIQLQDMDSDGVPETAVTFLRLPSAEHPLRICFFTRQPDGEDDYEFNCMVEGDGAAIYAVDYVELSGGGRKELVVSWQSSTNFYQLGVYSLEDGSQEEARPPSDQSSSRNYTEATELMLTNYSGYSLLDINQDGLTELAVIRLDSADGNNNIAEIYGWRGGAFMTMGAARLSVGVKSLGRVRSNFISGGSRALYITGVLVDGGQTTEILCWRDGELVNLTLDLESGDSRETIRGLNSIGPTDVNGDTILELPRPRPLPSFADGLSSDFWLIDWSQYDITGKALSVFTTYHNRDDSWYFEIPDSWLGKITIGRDDSVSGERAVIFYHWNGTETSPTPFLAIYRLTGVNRTVRAARGNRFILAEDESTIYAAAFLNNGWDCGLDEMDVLERFYRIVDGWTNDS